MEAQENQKRQGLQDKITEQQNLIEKRKTMICMILMFKYLFQKDQKNQEFIVLKEEKEVELAQAKEEYEKVNEKKNGLANELTTFQTEVHVINAFSDKRLQYLLYRKGGYYQQGGYFRHLIQFNRKNK